MWASERLKGKFVSNQGTFKISSLEFANAKRSAIAEFLHHPRYITTWRCTSKCVASTPIAVKSLMIRDILPFQRTNGNPLQ